MNPMKMLDDMRTIKQLLSDAERIAREMGDEEPAAEHVLLAAIGLPDGSAARVLGRHGVDADSLRTALRDEQSDALVTAGVPGEAAQALADPTPLGAAGTPLLYPSGPSAREVFQEAGKLARSSRQRLGGAHVVAAVAGLERGTMPRVLGRLGVDPHQLAATARVELAAR